MIKKKSLIILATIACLNIGFAKNVLAIEDVNNTNITKFPDYATEYVGKDKWESFNRKMFIFNMKANKYIILPITKVWASIMPSTGMTKIQNVFSNFNYPVRLVSNLCQKDTASAKSETKRFFINTTWGILGINDPALTKLNIKPTNENIEQALAYHNVKQGPYLVLPIIANGNIRDIGGSILDLPLEPTTYIIGPAATIASGISTINNYTRLQPLFKLADNYPDPYQVSKQMYGMDRFIKNTNIDRNNYVAENQNTIPIQNFSTTSNLTPDIQLYNYNSQGSLADAMRTILFDNKILDNSKWSELSVWNKGFAKQFKTASVKLDSTRPKYKYKYILQHDKNAPLAVIYPSIGENITSAESLIQAKLLYDQGYSVIIQGSAFQWQFVKSMPSNYRPGLPNQDAYYLRIMTSMIIDQLQNKYSCQFKKKILVGTSFGGLTGIFAAAQEDHDKKSGNKTIGFSNYIFICPPIQILYALKQIDNYSLAWKNYPTDEDLKTEAATTSEKVIQVTKKAAMNGYGQNNVNIPFSYNDAGIAIGFAMKQKLSDVVFTIEKAPTTKKSDIYNVINNMSFSDYAQKYLISAQNKPINALDYETSLYSVSDYLQNNKQYKIYHSLDDCFVNQSQLAWLKKETGNKSILFSNGSHLGFLYRKEFLNEFKKDTKLN